MSFKIKLLEHITHSKSSYETVADEMNVSITNTIDQEYESAKYEASIAYLDKIKEAIEESPENDIACQIKIKGIVDEELPVLLEERRKIADLSDDSSEVIKQKAELNGKIIVLSNLKRAIDILSSASAKDSYLKKAE